MLIEVMRHYRLARPPVDVGFFETEHHAQVARDLRAAIQAGRLIALTAVIGAGKTILSPPVARRPRARGSRHRLARADGREDKDHRAAPIAALFYDLSPEKIVSISSQSERRERDLQELFRKAKKPVALFVDDAHDLHPKTLTQACYMAPEEAVLNELRLAGHQHLLDLVWMIEQYGRTCAKT
jgi:type II secretory pathway predicted ATPase ExeA